MIKISPRKLVSFPLLVVILLGIGLMLSACGDIEISSGQPSTTPTSTRSADKATATSATGSVTISTTARVEPSKVSATVSGSAAATTHFYSDKIVYATTDGYLYLINPDGSNKTQLIEGKSPQFSPDGQKVAYISKPVTGSGDEFGRVNINSVKLDGLDIQNYCYSSANARLFLVRWSPRDRYIVLSGTQQEGPGSLSLCNTASNQPARETPTMVSSIVTPQGNATGIYDWSADGEKALWQAANSQNEMNLYYGNPDKISREAAQTVTAGQYRVKMETYPGSYYNSARISPDGKTIAIVGTKVFFVSVPSQNSPLAGKVIDGFSRPYQLAWSPDGRAVAVSDISGIDKGVIRANLKIVNLANSQITTLTEGDGTLDWSRQ